MKFLYTFILLNLIFLLNKTQAESSSEIQDTKKDVVLPPCKSCTVFVNSIIAASENVTNENDREGALAYVMHTVCSDVTRGYDQCIQLRDQLATDIERYVKQEGSATLFDTVCIEKLEVCCPPDHFGPECKKCEDCHKNGKCKGAGTRKGNGKCACNPGYTGEQCRECALLFYEAFRDESKLLCSHCHDACGDDGCTNAGPKNCRSCKVGWRMDPANGCTDINECLKTRNICTSKQFCVNNDGSYSCLECDRSCNGCDGDGPDMCKNCAEGYSLIEGKCTDDSLEKREQYVNLTRFLTYLGLCIATCVIFQSSTTKAYMVGAAVATYIAASEYWLNTTPAPSDIKSQINTKQLEDMIMNMM